MGGNTAKERSAPTTSGLVDRPAANQLRSARDWRRRGRPSFGLYRGGAVLPTPGSAVGAPWREELVEASVSEIHCYPLRPEGFEEPLFSTPESRRAVAEHLLGASWLTKASEIGGSVAGGQTVHVRRESVEVERRCGLVRVVWSLGWRRCRRERWVVEVLGRWREVGVWWDENASVDHTVVRVLLSDGAVVDLARESAGWFLVGVVD